MKRTYFLLMVCLLMGADISAQNTKSEPGYLQRILNMFRPVKDSVITIEDVTIAPDVKPGVTDRYSRIYKLVHKDERGYYRKLADSSYTKWDELHDVEDVKYMSPKGDTIMLGNNVKVFGWHPHWMDDNYLNYDYRLLSHISLFSYGVNTGQGSTYDNQEEVDHWKEHGPKIVELAQAEKCKVLLTITCFGERKNRKFLNDVNRQTELIADVIRLVKEIGANGVDVDFEDIPVGFDKQFSSFIKSLKRQLDAEGQDYLLTVVLPKINKSTKGVSIYQVDSLQKYVDLFTLTAYDFTTRGYAPGPISPLYNKDQLRGNNTCIEDVVYNYLKSGLQRKKLLIGLPYYGGQWTTYTRPNRVDTTVFDQLSYTEIKAQGKWRGAPDYLADSWSAYYHSEFLPEEDEYETATEEIWFDDEKTLAIKYDWVLKQGLGGIGIWALGYDQSNTELWGLIDDKFATTKDTIVYFVPQQTGLNLGATVLRYRDAIGVTGLFTFALLAIGFIWALFDWRVRAVFFKNGTLRILYIVATFALITATFSFLLFLNPGFLSSQSGSSFTLVATLALGLVLGAIMVPRISRWFVAGRGEVP